VPVAVLVNRHVDAPLRHWLRAAPWRVVYGARRPA